MHSEMTAMSFLAVKQGIQWNPNDARSLEEDMTGMGAETEWMLEKYWKFVCLKS